MADLINFTLPNIDSDTDDKTMKQIKNYLYQLTEQMKFYLNNIDSDNFTQAYAEKLNAMANSSTTNTTAITLTQKLLDKYRERFKAELIESANLISGNSGGFIVLRDVNDDGKPDELLIMNAESFENATKYWQWNQNGLMYVDKLNTDGDGNIIPSIALTMDGKINANCITTGILQGIEIRTAEGTIGGWKIDGTKLSTTWTNNGDTYKLTLNAAGADGENEDYVIRLEISGNTEYPFRILKDGTVDCGDLGVNNVNVASKLTVLGGLDIPTPQRLLWSGAYYMRDGQTITLSDSILNQPNGIILVFSAFVAGIAQNYDWNYYFVPKWHVLNRQGQGVDVPLIAGNFTHLGRKYLYINSNGITGHEKNNDSGSANGITYDNSYFVLREVLGA